MRDLRSDSYRVVTTTDCLSCGAEGPEVMQSENPEKARRWARRHARENPGHRAIVESVVARSYETRATNE